MYKLIRYVTADILRRKVIIAYVFFLLAISIGVFSIESSPGKAVLSLMHIVLFMVPLVSSIFPAIYVYNSAEFIELLVSQPIKRPAIWISLFAGLSGAVNLAFLAGAGIPVLIFAFSSSGLVLVVCGCMLSFIFVAMAMWIAVRIRDKARGIGMVIMLWLYFALLFDIVALFALFQLSEYPVEKGMVALTVFNPVDLSRILMLLQADVSAMMGYTGAIFRETFGSSAGQGIAAFVMILWVLLPFGFSLRYFIRKDL